MSATLLFFFVDKQKLSLFIPRGMKHFRRARAEKHDLKPDEFKMKIR